MPAPVKIKLTSAQSRAWKTIAPGSTTTTALGRGCGKSLFLRVVAYLLIAMYGNQRRGQQRGVRVVFLVDTLKHFRDIHAERLIHELEDPGTEDEPTWAFLGGKVNRTTLRVEFPNGSWIQPFPAAEHTSKAGRGIRCDVVLMDEADDIGKSVYEGVVIPWFSERWSLKICVAGGTPRRGRHGLLWHLYQCGLSKEPEHATFHAVHSDYRECPEIVDRGMVEKARATMLPAVFRREWECNFDSAEGLVYDLFDSDFHVRPVPADFFPSEVVVGLDWGYSDPGVILVALVQGHGADAVAWLAEEIYQPGQVDDWWQDKAEEIRSRYPDAKWFADPSQPSRIEAMRRRGINIVGANNKIDQGVSCVADKLWIRGDIEQEQDRRWARLFIDPKCKNTIREFAAYRRKPDPKQPDAYLEAIAAGNDHAMDALRYLCMGYFGTASSERVAWTTQEWG